MKVSELIEELQRVLKEEGDINVVGQDYDPDIPPLVYVSRHTEEDGPDDPIGTVFVIE